VQSPNSVQTFLDNLKIKTKPQVSNPRLQSAIDELFRSNATIIGGTAGAIIYERITGNLVGGKSHNEKGRQRLIQLQRIIQQEPLNPDDSTIATNLLDDLQSALNLNIAP